MAARKPLVLNSAQQQLIQAGDTLALPASATGGASLNAPHGTAPTSPVDGDVWTTTAGLFVRINGVTIGPLSTGSGGGALTQIAKYTADGTTGTHTFSSIPGSYTDLILSVVARTDNASNQSMAITVNGNTTGIYDYERLYSAGSVVPSHDNNASHTAIDTAFQMAGTGATANVATGGEITFFGYAMSFFKMFSARARHVESGTTQYQVFSTGEVRTTTAISSITCTLAAGNFVSGSCITLYGRQ